MTHAHPRTNPLLPLLLIAGCSLAPLAGCEASPEGREIELLVDDIDGALERGSVKQLFEATTDDFVALPGRLGRGAASRRLFVMFRLRGGVEALYPRPEIEIESATSARLSTPFVLVPLGAGDPTLDALYEDREAWLERAAQVGDVTHADLSLVRSNDRWLVQTARFH